MFLFQNNFNFKTYRYGITLKHSKQCKYNRNATRAFFDKISKHYNILRKKFPNISIPVVNSKDDYGCIFYEKENQRGPILAYIKGKIDRRFSVKTNHKRLDKGHNLDACTQFRAWSSNSDYMKQLQNFLTRYKYAKKTILTRITINRQLYELSWHVEPNKARDMINHWSSKNIPVNLTQSNYNQYIAKQKENAKASLQQATQYAISKTLASR